MSLNFETSFLCVGVRGGSKEDLPFEFARVIELPLKISLSKARNELMRVFPPEVNEIIFFPDDDCWFGKDTLANVEILISNYDFAIGVIDTNGEENSSVGFESQEAIDLETALKTAASAALFCRSESIIGYSFDEKLGLGTAIGSAEDLDLVLHLLSVHLKGVYSPNVRIGHPAKNKGMEYFPGSVAVLRKYTHIW